AAPRSPRARRPETAAARPAGAGRRRAIGIRRRARSRSPRSSPRARTAARPSSSARVLTSWQLRNAVEHGHRMPRRLACPWHGALGRQDYAAALTRAAVVSSSAALVDLPMDVRSRILEAALGLLTRSGAHELTQPRVAKAAGVRQSHLTYYFPGRTDLMQAVARHAIDQLAGQLAQAGVHSPARVATGIAAGSSDKRIARVMLGLVAAADRDPAIKRQLRRFIGELRQTMALTLAAGGLQAEPACVAFFHAVAIGCAVLQLARDNAEARSEAREVLRMAAGFIAKGKR